MNKIIIIPMLIVLALSSCSEEKEAKENEDITIETSSEVVEPSIAFENNWQILKNAIVTKNKPVVMTFVSNDDLLLKEAIDLSFDYIFDDEVILFIKNKSYNDLQTSIKDSEQTTVTEGLKYIQFEKEYNLNLDTTSISSAKSGFTIELSEINETIKITNFNTFHNVIEN